MLSRAPSIVIFLGKFSPHPLSLTAGGLRQVIVAAAKGKKTKEKPLPAPRICLVNASNDNCRGLVRSSPDGEIWSRVGVRSFKGKRFPVPLDEGIILFRPLMGPRDEVILAVMT